MADDFVVGSSSELPTASLERQPLKGIARVVTAKSSYLKPAFRGALPRSRCEAIILLPRPRTSPLQHPSAL